MKKPITMCILFLAILCSCNTPEPSNSTVEAPSAQTSSKKAADPPSSLAPESTPKPTSSAALHLNLDVAIQELYKEFVSAENVESLTFKPGSASASDQLKAIITYEEPYLKNDFPDLVKPFVDKVTDIANENKVIVFYLEVGLKQNDELSIYWQSYNKLQNNEGLKIGDIEDRSNNVRIEDVAYDNILRNPAPAQMFNSDATSNPSTTLTESSALPSPHLESSSASQASSTYETILDEYSKKLRAATPGLVAEYNSEAAHHTGDIAALAEISTKIIGNLASISAEGTEKMAEIMLYSGDSYGTYEEWATKLNDVYMEEASKITDAYMKSTM